MPEGHVAHRLARELNGRFSGLAVQVTSPQGRFAEAATLDRTVLEQAEAVGKHLLVDFGERGSVWIHLGLIGKLAVGPDVPPPSPQTVRLRIAARGAAATLRGPQWCRLLAPGESLRVLEASGPDPLRADADPGRAWALVRRTRRPMAAVLMDQRAFAGVGNIFRAEVLFRHGLDPFLPSAALPRPVFDSVWDDLVGLMTAAVEVGRIDTVDPEHLPAVMGREPRVDPHGGEVYVYRRAGQACHRCGGPVSAGPLAGRTVYWCPRCQPPGSRGELR